MYILSLNSGSSSVKFLLFDYDRGLVAASGIVERVTIPNSFIKYSAEGKDLVKLHQECPTHKEAIQLILRTLQDHQVGVIKDLTQISAVGHRVVHGGEKFTKSCIINDEVINTIKALYDLAPLHNPPNVLGIEAALEVMPRVPQMAILDTAWHQTMPRSAYMYATPYEWYEKYGVRRYGFHGTSFLYVSKRAAVLLGKDPFDCNLVCLHIGNGVSANAVKKGCSYDTSMGLTPLEGLVMGTRVGDHDAGIDFLIMEKEQRTPKQMNDILNKKSGILGITGKYSDRRDVEIAAAEGDERCRLAIDIECYRLKKYVGAYLAALGQTDAIVFTAGVGEMGDVIREKSLEGLEPLGVKLDLEKNRLSKTRNAETLISAADSKIKVFVIPTDEERVFIEDVVALLKGNYKEHTSFQYSFQSRDYINAQRQKEFEQDCSKKPGLRSIVALPPKR
jgi:acetate kinase